jgi:hypothetical protein
MLETKQEVQLRLIAHFIQQLKQVNTPIAGYRDIDATGGLLTDEMKIVQEARVDLAAFFEKIHLPYIQDLEFNKRSALRISALLLSEPTQKEMEKLANFWAMQITVGEEKEVLCTAIVREIHVSTIETFVHQMVEVGAHRLRICDLIKHFAEIYCDATGRMVKTCIDYTAHKSFSAHAFLLTSQNEGGGFFAHTTTLNIVGDKIYQSFSDDFPDVKVKDES